MNIKLALYNFLVNRVPGIKYKFKKKRQKVKGIGRVGAILYLFGLNISYYIFRNKKLDHVEQYPFYEEKKLYDKGSESSLSKLESPREYAKELAEYDVISFDVFDTLIFRPFSKPTDLFYILGCKLGYLDFERIRQEMEYKARCKKYKKAGHYEVTLEEIYDVLSKETGIPKQTMDMEVQLEQEFCFANPFMYQVVEELLQMNKKIIITSDMYLNTEQIKQLLKSCGYPEFQSYYVSCDCGCSKSDGSVFDMIKEQEGCDCKFIHIGDNQVSDVEKPKKKGFDTKHYINVNEAGYSFRANDMSAITGSAYRGLVNSHIHNGLNEYSREYEYGYIYGGLFVTGYCQFIHNYVKDRNIKDILFLARDGYVLKQAYEMLYPKEADNLKYIYWSRLAATKMAAGYFKYDYFRRFIYHKVNQGYTIEAVLDTMEISDMLDDMCKSINISGKAQLTDGNADKIKEYLNMHWSEVTKHYEPQLEAGKKYFTEELKGVESAAVVDIGWAGSGAVTLDYLINKVWSLNCDITGIVAGTNSCYNAEPDASEPLLAEGKLVSYLYSQSNNRDLWKVHDPDKGYNLYWEMFLDAPHGSLRGFYLDEHNNVCFNLKEYKSNGKVEEIQRGILDFVAEYNEHFGRFKMFSGISGRDAYAPVILALSSENEGFRQALKGMQDDANLV